MHATAHETIGNKQRNERFGQSSDRNGPNERTRHHAREHMVVIRCEVCRAVEQEVMRGLDVERLLNLGEGAADHMGSEEE